MKILLTDAGKRFNRDWIFRHLTYEFSSEQSYAITGPNGSGKSTLLQVMAGSMQLNEGKIEYRAGNKELNNDEVFAFVSICAPYLEVVEEMTLLEFFKFHTRFKPFLSSVTPEQIISLIGLENAAHKQIRFYSSGMKQRVKLAQAIFSDVPVVLLDEPCTNLDEAGFKLYNQLMNDYCQKRMVIVSSNDYHEYAFCSHRLTINEWK
jgi:ABC-type multidrug transport system ATPase subunit